ncbi:MAG: hypothetical protein LBH19_03420, partial [Dysgonamonadaceae bacterium]|nr:hypothetical protein [Dysgonamonadaceae bacterium]
MKNKFFLFIVLCMQAWMINVCAQNTSGTSYTLSYEARGGTVEGGTPAGNYPPGTLITLPSSAYKATCFYFDFFESNLWEYPKGLGETFVMPAAPITVTVAWGQTCTYAEYIQYSNGGILSGGSPEDV